MEFFYSKSKAAGSEVCGRKDWKRVLSAFYPCDIEVDGKIFSCIECAFHYEKYKRTNHPKIGDVYIKGGPFDINPGKGKVYSGKSSMKKLGCNLNVKKWGKESKEVMKFLVKKRYEKDIIFRNIIENAPRPLLHFERGTMKKIPIYGCFRSKETGELVGENFYGKLLMNF